MNIRTASPRCEDRLRRMSRGVFVAISIRPWVIRGVKASDWIVNSEEADFYPFSNGSIDSEKP
jgi:hypothetical protein